ncbi:MAG: Hsp70 family protein [Pirellulaceae bacterium]
MSADELLENQPSRFVVGIDLGTTNSAVCYVDTHERPWRVRVLEIPQLVAPSQVESRDTLPSFHYQPPAGERNATEGVPYTVGFLARDWGAGQPGRVVASAKSWLCHTGVDRTAELLPWHAAADVERISPVEASSRYLAHQRDAWNQRFKSEPLDRQDIVLTLPASFDEIARELTVQAAARAGLARVVLIEEPQAAFYAWIYKHQANWDQLARPGQKILVCDIGGGTTDFTLIRVRRSEQGKVQFHRVAVGDHLLLGGDNMDLALAQHLEARLTQASGVRKHPDSEATSIDLENHREADASRSPESSRSLGKLQPRQWDVLLRASRQAKEQLLADAGPPQITVAVPGTGSKLIGGALQTHVTRDEARQVLVEGFMPRVALADKPAARRSGFQEFGLPYAADAAITRYLAAFLTAHRHAGDEQGRGASGEESGVDPARPDVVLFNGGVFDSPVLRQRLLDCLDDWFGHPLAPSRQPPAPLVLDNDRLDLAVARGAAYYGMVRRGEGVKIVASLARTYYIGVDAETPSTEPRTPNPEPRPYAVCLVPGSAEPGQTVELASPQFDLTVSEPVEFPLYTSSIRLADRAGELLPVDPEQMTALPPIRTALKTRTRRERGTVAVRLHAKLTEIGTLELWCGEVNGDRTWRLQFDVRSATQTDKQAHTGAAESEGFVDDEVATACRSVLQTVFAGTDKPDAVVKRLVEAAGSERHEWPTSLLRRLWEMLMELESGRRKSPPHEARWLNLLGYALRPGYGLAVDDWRVAETWKSVQGKLAHAAPTSRTESLILWRRIAGGLSSGQQRALAEPLLAAVRTLHKRQTRGQGTEPTFSPHESVEVLRLLGSLELLPGETKIELGRLLAELLPKKKLESIRPALAWALGRLGARQPAYGPLNTVVPPEQAGEWIVPLLELDKHDGMTQFALVNLARRTHDRYRDLADPLRSQVLDWLVGHKAGEHAQKLVREGGELESDEQDRVFGEALPKGLRVR